MEDKIFGPHFDTHIDHLEEPLKTRQANLFMAIEKRQIAWTVTT